MLDRAAGTTAIVIHLDLRRRRAGRVGRAGSPRAKLTDPEFEREDHGLLRLWLLRALWRRRLRRELGSEPPEVLADFGITPAALRDYARRPVWRR